MSLTRVVLGEIAAGTATVADLAARTGVDRDVVALVLDRLVAAGRLEVQALATGCPAGGCAGCGAGVAGRPGCGRDAPSGGPVLLTLGARPS